MPEWLTAATTITADSNGTPLLKEVAELDDAGNWPPVNAFRGSLCGNAKLLGNTIGGFLNFSNVAVFGHIEVSDCSIHGDLIIKAAQQDAERPSAGLLTECTGLDLDKLQCNGDLWLTGLHVKGDMKAGDATVKGIIELAPRRGKEHPYVDDRACSRIDGRLDLSAVNAGHLVITGETFPAAKRMEAPDHFGANTCISLERGNLSRLEIEAPTPPIDLSRLKVDRWIFGMDRRSSAASYIRILERMSPFERDSWIDVEQGLRNQVLDREADKVYRRMRAMARSEMRGARWFWDWLKDLSVAHGTQAWRPLVLWALLLVLAVFVFTQPQNIVSSLPVFAPNGTLVASPAASPEHWTLGDGVVMAMRHTIPLVDLGSNDEWVASDNDLLRPAWIRMSAEAFAVAITLLSNILLSVAVLGLTAGLVRGRRE
jgi:hypothetical protein